MNLMSYMRSVVVQNTISKRYVHVSTVCNKSQSGRYRIKAGQLQYLTYEMANPPHFIAARKSWNSWNTSNIKDGNRPSETAVDDMFIRKFISGTWHNLCGSETIIKRQHNIVRIAFILKRKIIARKIYFLLGYTEEFLSYWLQCPVKLEIVTADPNDTIYKVI
ncbi:mitochondrial ribosomal protein S24 isoform X2 [Ptiloglossa arizonensis]|uniref:mitochondrial ribosomal protein S24 isoform X2 n=1 Tax=Ptiloglossa arizonensis TaxID=3350558 RepID=UPI003F9EFB43